MEGLGERAYLSPAGPAFLRYQVMDMRGFMDIEFCYPFRKVLQEDANVRAGFLAAGKYARLMYSGGGISGNRALIEQVRSQGRAFDRRDTEEGGSFRSRYERYLTDPEIEPRKSKWQIDVAIKLAGN